MSEWQPIESAPLDTWILVYGDCYGNAEEPPIGVCRAFMETIKWWEQATETTKELRSRTEISWEGAWITPTHWMPLPTPPAA